MSTGVARADEPTERVSTMPLDCTDPMPLVAARLPTAKHHRDSTLRLAHERQLRAIVELCNSGQLRDDALRILRERGEAQ
jgi:hypothetical protein